MHPAAPPPAFFPVMSTYNAWMNDQLYALCATLSDQERKRDRGAFFRSIHGALNHLLWGDRIWLARFTGGERPAGNVGEAGIDPGVTDLPWMPYFAEFDRST